MTVIEMRAEIVRIDQLIATSEERVNSNIVSGVIDQAKAYDYYTVHATRIHSFLDRKLDLLDMITSAQ